nr:DUF6440 family protein [uncultured Oscillibacter sp.]
MEKEQERFVTAYQENTFGVETRVLVDRITGVNYLFARFGGGSGGAGLTPLLDPEGKPILTTISDEE